MQKHYVAWGDWCSDIRTLQDAEEIVAAYAASEVDPEIARLKADNARLLALCESQDQASDSQTTLIQLLKAALRWCLENAGIQGIDAYKTSILDSNGEIVDVPPQFAAVIAEAVKS